MNEFEIFDIYELETVCRRLIQCMAIAYASGYEHLDVYINCEFAFNCIERWSNGWNRKSGAAGEWKNSRGNFCITVRRKI